MTLNCLEKSINISMLISKHLDITLIYLQLFLKNACENTYFKISTLELFLLLQYKCRLYLTGYTTQYFRVSKS